MGEVTMVVPSSMVNKQFGPCQVAPEQYPAGPGADLIFYLYTLVAAYVVFHAES